MTSILSRVKKFIISPITLLLGAYAAPSVAEGLGRWPLLAFLIGMAIVTRALLKQFRQQEEMLRGRIVHEGKGLVPLWGLNSLSLATWQARGSQGRQPTSCDRITQYQVFDEGVRFVYRGWVVNYRPGTDTALVYYHSPETEYEAWAAVESFSAFRAQAPQELVGIAKERAPKLRDEPGWVATLRKHRE